MLLFEKIPCHTLILDEIIPVAACRVKLNQDDQIE